LISSPIGDAGKLLISGITLIYSFSAAARIKMAVLISTSAHHHENSANVFMPPHLLDCQTSPHDTPQLPPWCCYHASRNGHFDVSPACVYCDIGIISFLSELAGMHLTQATLFYAIYYVAIPADCAARQPPALSRRNSASRDLFHLFAPHVAMPYRSNAG